MNFDPRTDLCDHSYNQDMGQVHHPGNLRHAITLQFPLLQLLATADDFSIPKVFSFQNCHML